MRYTVCFALPAIASFLMVFGGYTSAGADTPGKHPHYLHALSDLRHARAHLDKLTPNEVVDVQEQHAIIEIDAAIREIKTASIDDGKNLADHPPIDANISKAGRYQKALELLHRAGADINREEDDPAAQGLQHRALMHVQDAEATVESIIVESHPHGAHPAYLHALSDLRFARAHLEKFGPNEVANARELHAIEAIDAAIREIRGASIDDGKNLADHPSIDLRLHKTDRYHKALELLAKASDDVRREEDDRAAQGLQHRALVHIGVAEKAVREALDAVDK
jgi:tetratricopeptide (TPR) repeat protein